MISVMAFPPVAFAKSFQKEISHKKVGVSNLTMWEKVTVISWTIHPSVGNHMNFTLLSTCDYASFPGVKCLWGKGIQWSSNKVQL